MCSDTSTTDILRKDDEQRVVISHYFEMLVFENTFIDWQLCFFYVVKYEVEKT